MFAVAYVILPFSDIPPAETIGTSLARFQRGQRGELPEKWLAFDDETEALRRVYEAHLTFIEKGTGGLQIKGDEDVSWYIDIVKVKKEMRRLAQRHWSVRFADTMEEFFNRFSRDLERHPDTGGFGRWLNPVGTLAAALTGISSASGDEARDGVSRRFRPGRTRDVPCSPESRISLLKR